MKYIVILVLVMIGLNGCSGNDQSGFEAKYTIIQNGKILGYSVHNSSYDSGCKSVYGEFGKYEGRVCGSFFIKKRYFDKGTR